VAGAVGALYRARLSRLVPNFSVRTWEFQREKSHKNEKVTAFTHLRPWVVVRCFWVGAAERVVEIAGSVWIC